jgi:cyclopropane fatty-acyl-phospholipid synthase-like methyltransferase
VPTNTKDLNRINSLANLSTWRKFLEIGCWDAKVCHFIAKKNLTIQVVWVEINPLLFIAAKIRNFISPQKNLTIFFKSLYNIDFSWFDIIYVFWMPESMARNLKRKFEQELKDDARIFSYAFPLEWWKGKYIKDKPDWKLSIYIYSK